MNELRYFDEDQIYYDDIIEITENRITELSRQLQTYLNNRKATIRAMGCNFNNSSSLSSLDSIRKWEKELLLRIQEYMRLLKNLGLKKDFKLRFLCLVEIAKSSPNSIDTRLFKNFLKNKMRLWQILHILSGLDIHLKPHLLSLIIKTLTRLCHDEKQVNEITPDFFKQIQLNYEQIEKEFDYMTKEDEHIKNSKSKVMVRE